MATVWTDMENASEIVYQVWRASIEAGKLNHPPDDTSDDPDAAYWDAVEARLRESVDSRQGHGPGHPAD